VRRFRDRHRAGVLAAAVAAGYVFAWLAHFT
jgi:hypothetical protein